VSQLEQLKIKPRKTTGIRPGFAVKLAQIFLSDKPQNTKIGHSAYWKMDWITDVLWSAV
jgi:hypothetical protein